MKTCLRCGSTNVVKVLPASMAGVLEAQQAVERGEAEICCCCAGTGGTDLYKCKDCNFQWDYLFEKGYEMNKEDLNHSSEHEKKKLGFLTNLLVKFKK